MEESILCYICYDSEAAENPYLKEPAPCSCKGSIMIHKDCLNTVLKTSRNCSICKNKYNVKYLPTKNGLELITETAINGDITEYTITEEGDRHGEYIVKKSTGELISQSYYQCGLLDGPYKTWYYSGQLECECTCVNNKIHGLYKSWYENGLLMEEAMYHEGVKDGLCKKYDNNGKLITKRNYQNGEVV